jgi:uncharacterized protein YhaN
MRLKRLDMKAFGPFTSQTLEFDSKAPGLHIIFGQNEAGKSSSLRALKALLFGFHQRTPDNFLHNYDQLLVGGCLENSVGQELIFQRRKRRVGDIIDTEGNPLDQSILAPFLHGVEPEIFESLYGIDHEILVRGGEDILAQKGEVGQALFAAGAGISSLREVIDQLEKEAAELFKSAGQLPEINRAVKRFKELQKEVKTASLSSKDWKDLQSSLKSAREERNVLEKERDDFNKELRRLERLEQAIPVLGVLKNLNDQLEAFGDVVLLPADFSERHQRVTQEIREKKLQCDRDSVHLKQLEEKKDAISFNKGLLDQAERVDDFHKRLGEYQKGQKDRPERNGMRISLRKDAALFLKQVRQDLPLEEVETLRPALFKKKTMQTLSRQYEAINQQLTLAGKQKKAAEQELQKVKERLAAIPSTADDERLLQAVKLAQKAGEIDAHLEKSSSEVAQDQKECRSELKRIGLWSGELASLKELALPLFETVKKFEKKFSDLADERRGLEKERKEAEKELQNAIAEARKMGYAGEVPSEEELIRTRERREQGWQLLCRQWLEQENVAEESSAFAPEQPLPEAYEASVNQADLIADRLRREAERVANAAALRSQIEKQNGILNQNNRLREQLDSQAEKLEDEWNAIWALVGIVPLPPREMGNWLTEIDKLRFRVTDLFKKELQIEQDVKHRQLLRQAVLKELKDMGVAQVPEGDELVSLLVLAETVLDRIAGQRSKLEKLKERQEQAHTNFVQASEDYTTAQEALGTWQEEWHKALLGLGLENELSTLEAVDCFDALQSCFDKLKEADDLQKRINGIDRDTEKLELEVRALLEKVAPDMLILPVDQAILQLRTMLGQAQKDGALLEKLSEEHDALQAEISTIEVALQNANEQMDELLRIAQCEKPEELPPLIDRFIEFQRLREKSADTTAALVKIGGGVQIDQLAKQAAEINGDELPGRIDSLKSEVDGRVHPEINRISQVIGEISNKLAAMDGSAKAAEAAERMEQELARIRRLAGRYARVKLASKILQQEIERYREEHQDPVLKIASRYFADLTLGSFKGLKTDVDDKGEPILLGIRPGDVWVTVDGMSDGTRDQLYLALRMATLEWRLTTSEPMPFIVDDILINFDDERSQATLKALADLAARNQVILFTHHRQIVNEARKLSATGTIHIHEI